MRRLIYALLFLPGVAGAEGMWVKMTGAEISEALTGRVLEYGAQWQDFRASGRTLYNNAGRDSWGYWAVRGDQYCSMWPPSDLWACYDIARKGQALRFIDAGGEVTEAVFRGVKP